MQFSTHSRPTLVLFLAILGCSSSSSPDTAATDAAPSDAHAAADTGTADSSTGPDSSSADDSSATPLSFSADLYEPVIKKHCIFCHGPTADGGAGVGELFGKLDLSSVDAGYTNLVNVAAQGGECIPDSGSPLLRVAPGDASASLLYLKVNGYNVAPPCGGPMPKSGEIPDGGQDIVAEQIQTWINQGALP